MEFDKQAIESIARDELRQEQFREAVAKEKIRITSKKWWHNLLPFKILIIRR